ncbi:cytochrome c-type biogenesis protein [Moraxella oblonga]|uniref:cytochrome c-type biogenesis protein n=1 Tax=Moraxella oblonga TaxID=200413 RepID=UPI001FE2267E|nr:cytochrome c-type biogenesis protein [Moraxella oblonga]
MTDMITTRYIKSTLIALVLSINMASFGAIELREFKTPEDETRYKALIEEFRCPKCQNQNLAGSDAPIAVDLKNQTYQMIQEGRSDTEIRNYMFKSYGDFISYKPPMRPSTWILWLFPYVVFAILVLGWIYITKKRRHVAHADDVRALSRAEEEKLNTILAKHNNNEDKP